MTELTSIRLTMYEDPARQLSGEIEADLTSSGLMFKHEDAVRGGRS